MIGRKCDNVNNLSLVFKSGMPGVALGFLSENSHKILITGQRIPLLFWIQITRIYIN